jgi:predicted Zn-dependent peptidase
VHAGIDNAKVNDAISVIMEELRKIRENPVSADEFRRAKEFYLAQLSLALEDTLDHMLWIGESVAALDKTYTLEDIIREVRKVKIDEIREVAARLFKEEKINLALIGPLKDKEPAVRSQLKL